MNEDNAAAINFYRDIPSNVACGKRAFKTANSRWSGVGVARKKQRNKSAKNHW